ncbi:MAG: hypothetical protein AABY16_02330 [Nanoarchaeota archaeon]
MNFLKLTYLKIFITFVLFVATAFFFLPINVNAVCAIGEDCPILKTVIRITELNNTPTYVSINFWILGAYLIIEYIVVAAIVALSGRGGAINLIMKK